MGQDETLKEIQNKLNEIELGRRLDKLESDILEQVEKSLKENRHNLKTYFDNKFNTHYQNTQNMIIEESKHIHKELVKNGTLKCQSLTYKERMILILSGIAAFCVLLLSETKNGRDLINHIILLFLK